MVQRGGHGGLNEFQEEREKREPRISENKGGGGQHEDDLHQNPSLEKRKENHGGVRSGTNGNRRGEQREGGPKGEGRGPRVLKGKRKMFQRVRKA